MMRRPNGATSLFILIATSHAIAVLAGLPFKTTGTRRVAADPLDNHVRDRVLKKGKGNAKAVGPLFAAEFSKLAVAEGQEDKAKGEPVSCCIPNNGQTYFCKYEKGSTEVHTEATTQEKDPGVGQEEAFVAAVAEPGAEGEPTAEGAKAAEAAAPAAEGAPAAEVVPAVQGVPEAEAVLAAEEAAPEAEAAAQGAKAAPEAEAAEPEAEAAEPAADAEASGAEAEAEAAPAKATAKPAEAETPAEIAEEVLADAVAENSGQEGCGNDEQTSGGGRRAAAAAIENDTFASKEEAYIRRGHRITVKGADKSGSLGLDTRGLKGKGHKGAKEGKKAEASEGAQSSEGAESSDESLMDGAVEVQANDPHCGECPDDFKNTYEECQEGDAMKAAEAAEKARAADAPVFAAAEAAPVAKAEGLSAGYAALIGLSGLVVLVVAFLFLKKRRSSNQGEMMIDKDFGDDTGTDVMSSNSNVGILNEVALAEEDDGGFEFQLGNNRID